MPPPDPIWDDLATLAFELLAKPDDRARDDAAEGDARAADEKEGER
jgi:hypothetical protein